MAKDYRKKYGITPDNERDFQVRTTKELFNVGPESPRFENHKVSVDRVLKAIDTFTKKQQATFLMRNRDRKTYAQIGEEFGTTSSAAYQTVKTVHRKLRHPMVRESIVEPKEEEKVEGTSIYDLAFSIRTSNALVRNGVRTLEDLAEQTEKKLLTFRNFGTKSLQEVKEKLASLGLQLKEKEEAVEPDILPEATTKEPVEKKTATFRLQAVFPEGPNEKSFEAKLADAIHAAGGTVIQLVEEKESLDRWEAKMRELVRTDKIIRMDIMEMMLHHNDQAEPSDRYQFNSRTIEAYFLAEAKYGVYSHLRQSQQE